MVILFRARYELPAHVQLHPQVHRSLRRAFERTAAARDVLKWAQAGQMLVTLCALVGLALAAVLGRTDGAAMAVVIAVVWVWFMRGFAAAVAVVLSPHFREFVRAHSPTGRAIECARCGYDLRHTTCARCPECGSRVGGSTESMG